MILKIVLLVLLLPSRSNSGKTNHRANFSQPSILTEWHFITEDGTSELDPWLIADREVIWLALLNSTRIPALFGEDNLGNVLWGLVIQTQWQISSGRQQSNFSERINEFAWFADINYQLIVVPFIVAMNSGLVEPTKLAPPQSNSPTKFPVIFEAIVKEVADGWTTFFETIKALQRNATYISLAKLQQQLWAAHTKTLTQALPEFERELQLLNIKERKFANGFGHFVEIPAMLNLNTSHDIMSALNQLFPQRILKLTDVPLFMFDMTVEQNTIVSAFFAIDDLTKVPFGWEKFLGIFRLLLSSGNL